MHHISEPNAAVHDDTSAAFLATLLNILHLLLWSIAGASPNHHLKVLHHPH